MTNTLAQTDSWSTVPLCCRYFSVFFAEQPVQVLGNDGTSHELTTSWALGVLHDSNWEVLGGWPRADAGPAFWRGVFDEFGVRGVGKPIPFILADAVRDVRAACPDAAVLPSFGRILRRRHASVSSEIARLSSEARRAVREAASVRGARLALERLVPKQGICGTSVLAADWPEVLTQLEAFYALRPQRRAVVRQGDEVSEHLSRILSRAVIRHGSFASLEGATSFVASTLARAEQRLKFPDLVELAPPRRAAGPVGARVAVSGS